jgi:hypothetical protein
VKSKPFLRSYGVSSFSHLLAHQRFLRRITNTIAKYLINTMHNLSPSKARRSLSRLQITTTRNQPLSCSSLCGASVSIFQAFSTCIHDGRLNSAVQRSRRCMGSQRSVDHLLSVARARLTRPRLARATARILSSSA